MIKNIKTYINGDSLELLNDAGFTLKQIGDFIDNIMDEISDQDLEGDTDINNLVTKYFLEELEIMKKEKEQEQDMIRLSISEEASHGKRMREKVSEEDKRSKTRKISTKLNSVNFVLCRSSTVRGKV